MILCACSRARCARWQVAELSTAGTKMLVSNLGPEVTDEDLKELFVEHGGPIKKAEIFYKQDGTSSGQGEVVFKKRADADKAIKTLNNVPLDGKPLQLALVGVSSAAAPQPRKPMPYPKSPPRTSPHVFPNMNSDEARASITRLSSAGTCHHTDS